MSQTQLTQKKCQPCEGIGSALSREKAQDYLNKIADWQMDDAGKMIFREFIMKNLPDRSLNMFIM